MDLYLHSPSTPSWCGALLKKKAQGQLYLYLTSISLLATGTLYFKIKNISSATFQNQEALNTKV
jgi:hypothetical protein